MLTAFFVFYLNVFIEITGYCVRDTSGIYHAVSSYRLHPQIFIKIFVENFVENFLGFSVKYILIFSIFVLLKRKGHIPLNLKRNEK